MGSDDCAFALIYNIRLDSPTSSLPSSKTSPGINGKLIPWETIVNGVQRLAQIETVVYIDNLLLTCGDMLEKILILCTKNVKTGTGCSTKMIRVLLTR